MIAPPRMAQTLLKISVVYLLLAALLGLYMGAMEGFLLSPVHAHLGVLGWLSLAMAGVVYHLYPAAAATPLAKIHFWLHNIGLPIFMVGLAILLLGHPGAGPIVGIGGAIVVIGIGCFVLNVLLLRAPRD